MTVGFETYIKGTSDLQLSNTQTYFRLLHKITPALPAAGSSAWVRRSVSSTLEYAFYYTDIVLNVPLPLSEKIALVVQPTRFPSSFYYSIIGRSENQVKIRLQVYDRSSTFNFYVFGTSAPQPNVSKKGLELYNESRLVFASETRYLKPLVMVDGDTSAEARKANVSYGFPIGVLCMNQFTDWFYDWEYEDQSYTCIFSNSLGNAELRYFTSSTNTGSGTRYENGQSGRSVFMYVDLRGFT